MTSPITTQRRITANVRMFMVLRGLRSTDLAATLDQQRRTVADKLAGKLRWTWDDLEKLVDLLECDATDLTADPGRIVGTRPNSGWKSPEAIGA